MKLLSGVYVLGSTFLKEFVYVLGTFFFIIIVFLLP